MAKGMKPVGGKPVGGMKPMGMSTMKGGGKAPAKPPFMMAPKMKTKK